MARIPGMRRKKQMLDVRDHLLVHGPSTGTAIARALGLSHSAVGQAITDIRNDPHYEYVRVPTHGDGYTHKIVVTVDEAKAGIRNQQLHKRTRGESEVTAGEKLMKIAATPEDYALAGALIASGRVTITQAESVLAAIK